MYPTKRAPKKYDWIGEWFLTKRAARLGLAFTMLFCAMCIPDMAAAFAPRCSIWARLVVVPRLWGTYKPQTKCDQPLAVGR